MITMRGISRFVAETLNTNAEFIALCTTEVGTAFDYYVNVDMQTVEEVTMPYFAVVTFNDKDEKEIEKSFLSQFLIGIERTKPVLINGIMEEASINKLETLVNKALEILALELRTFGIQGDTNIRISYTNKYVPNPEGEDDLQMQVDIELQQDKYLAC